MALDNTIQSHLIAQAKQGSQSALQELYNNYCNAMFNICLKMTNNKENAEDVLHDAFVIAFKSLHQLKSEILFGGWLKRIVVNECIKYCKKQFNNISWQDEQFKNLADDDSTLWWQNIPIQKVFDAMNELPAGCKQIFYLYAVEDFAHKDIATQLSISEGTSKSQYHRAKKLLKEKLSLLNN